MGNFGFCAVRWLAFYPVAVARTRSRKIDETNQEPREMASPIAIQESPNRVENDESNGQQEPLGSDELHRINACWRASNYLSVGQIYLYDNPLSREPLTLAHVKPLVIGHRGTTPGQNFIYVHLKRVINKCDLDMFYVAGPGHGGPAIMGQTYLEGTWSEVYPNVTQDEAGLKKLFTQFSFPGGISSHLAPTTPGSIHEGGEPGFSLMLGVAIAALAAIIKL
jgi:xylulose-5-phosphate/fructose-6-phosphate phosphoketolase